MILDVQILYSKYQKLLLIDSKKYLKILTLFFWSILQPKLDEIVGLIIPSKLDQKEWNKSSKVHSIRL